MKSLPLEEYCVWSHVPFERSLLREKHVFGSAAKVQTAQHWVLPVIRFIGSSTLCKKFVLKCFCQLIFCRIELQMDGH